MKPEDTDAPRVNSTDTWSPLGEVARVQIRRIAARFGVHPATAETVAALAYGGGNG